MGLFPSFTASILKGHTVRMETLKVPMGLQLQCGSIWSADTPSGDAYSSGAFQTSSGRENLSEREENDLIIELTVATGEFKVDSKLTTDEKKSHQGQACY